MGGEVYLSNMFTLFYALEFTNFTILIEEVESC